MKKIVPTRQSIPRKGDGLHNLEEELHGLKEYEEMCKRIDIIKTELDSIQNQLEGFVKSRD